MPYPGDDNEFGSNSYDGGNRGIESSAPAVQTEEEVRQAIEKNKNALGNFQLKTDADGNAKMFGMKVDKATLPLVMAAVDGLKVALLQNGNRFYKFALDLALKAKLKGRAASTAAAIADTSLRWGIITAEQISTTVDASGEYAKKRQDLYQFFHPIMEATSATTTSNEVIGLAYKRARTDYTDSLKSMLTDLPRIAPMAWLGYNEQIAAHKRYATEYKDVVNLFKDPLALQNSEAQRAIEEAKRHLQAETTAHEFIKNNRQSFIDAQVGRLTDAERQDQAIISAIHETYDNVIAPELRKKIMPKEATGETSRHGYDDKDKPNSVFYYISLGGNAISQIFKSNWAKKHDKETTLVHVPEMVDHLRKEIAEQLDGVSSKNQYGRFDSDKKSANDIQITNIGRDGDPMPLKAYILKMFQQHERDRDPSINWIKKNKDGDIEVIDPMGPALVAKLQPSIDMIAEAVASGLDPAALVNLIGDNKVIIHGKNGAKTFANEDKVRDAIDQLIPVMSSHEVIKMEEYLSKFEKPDEVKNSIKNNLETMQGSEKVLFAALFPNDILKQLGMKHKDIMAMRKAAHAGVYDFVAANVMHLAKSDDEQLKKLGLAEGEIESIKNLAEKIESGDEKAVKKAVDGHDKGVIDAVRTAGLLEQQKSGGSKDYWAARIAEMHDAHDKLNGIVKKTEAKPEETAEAKEPAKEANESKDSAEPKEFKESKDTTEFKDSGELKSSDDTASARSDDGDSISHVERVSNKRNGKANGRNDSDSEEKESSSFADDFEGTRGRMKPADSALPAGFAKRENARSAAVDDERMI